MEALIVLFMLALVAAVLGGSVLGIVAFIRVLEQRRFAEENKRAIETLAESVAHLARLQRKEAPAPPEHVPEKPAAAVPPAPAEGEKVEVLLPAGPEAAPPQEPAAPPVGREWWGRFEEEAGKRWMTWAGAVALFFAVAYFVKYAIDREWLGPRTQVCMGVTFGILMLVLGDLSLRRKMRALGQGLVGGGLAILYVSLFAAFSFYHLVPQLPAFAAMVIVTAAGMTLAVLHNALPVSFLAVLGGLLTPVLLSTGEDARDALFSYLVLLNLGVLGVALFRGWRALDALAFVGTAGLFAGWYFEFYDQSAMVPTLLWLAGFYVIFLLLPFLHHLRHGTLIALERFVMALANAALAFTCAYAILRVEHRHVLGFVALGMAACYAALGSQIRRRISADSRGLFGFIALAVFFLTMAVPLHLKVHGITLAWAIEGPVLLYLGCRYRYRPVRIGGFIVLVLASLRLFIAHSPLHDAAFTPIWNRHFGGVIFLPLASAAFAFIHHRWRKEALPADRALKLASAIGGGFIALMILHAELGLWLQYSERPYLARCAVVVVWAAGALCFLGGGVRARSLAPRVAGLGALAIALLLAFRPYAHDVPGDYLIFLNARFIAGLAAVLAVFYYAFVLRRRREICTAWEQRRAQFLYAAGGLTLLALLSAEAYSYCIETVSDRRKAEWTALMSVSLVWGIYAAAALSVGFWRRVRPLRLSALGLFGVTALKLVLVDIAGVKQVYRILSFFVVGLLMIAGAYLYHRAEKLIREFIGGEQ